MPPPAIRYDPNNPQLSLTNPNEFSPLYTADTGASQNQFQDLAKARAFILSLPESDPDRAFYLSEIDNYIQAQQGVSGHASAVQGMTDLPDAIAQQQSVYTQGRDAFTNWQSGRPLSEVRSHLQQNYPEVYSQISPDFWANPQNYSSNPNNYLLTQARSAFDSLRNQVPNRLTTAAQSQLNTAQTGAAEGFYIPRPNIGGAQRGLRDFYYGSGDNPGQISLSTRPVMHDLYRQSYNIRNNVNQRMAATGQSSSGTRRRALSELRSGTGRAAVDVRSRATEQAESALTGFSREAERAERDRIARQQQIAQGGMGSILSDATRDYLSSYRDTTSAELQQRALDAQRDLDRQASDDDLWSGILDNAFSGFGQYAGGRV